MAAAGGLGGFLLMGSAAAQNRFTVQQLNELCASTDTQRQSACSAYIAGVRHTLDVFKGSLKQRVDYCIPPAASNREIKDHFIWWARQNASAAGQLAVIGVIRSVREKYACKPSGEKFEF